MNKLPDRIYYNMYQTSGSGYLLDLIMYVPVIYIRHILVDYEQD
jgi:hypothetical protein